MNSEFDGWKKRFLDETSIWETSIRGALDSCIAETGSAVISKVVSPFRLPDRKDRPLCGIPYALKEAFDLSGLPTTGSSVIPCLAEGIARTDAAVVEHLNTLGAVCVAKSQMNELAYGLSGENPHFGNCPHPTLPNVLSGGSSSGSAHLVGRGAVPFSIGTDTGGSIRVPAALCGLFGIRWKPGYLTEGMLPLAKSYDTIGWLTPDCAGMQQMLEAWFPEEADKPKAKLRIASLPSYACVDQESRTAIKPVLSALATEVIEDAEHWSSRLPDARTAFNTLQSAEAYLNHKALIEAHGALMDRAVVGRILRARQLTREHFAFAEKIRDQFIAFFDQVFSCFDCLVMPICPGAANPRTQTAPALREDTLNLTTPASLAGLPALAVPVFLDQSRSIGLQFIFPRAEPDIPLRILEQWSSI